MPPALKAREVAELLSMSDRGVYGLVRSGRLPKIEIGEFRYRIPTWAVQELFEGTASPESAGPAA